MTASTPLGREFGERLRQRRTDRGLTQAALARESQVHWTLIGQLERGERRPGLRTLLSIAYGLDVPPGELLDDTPPELFLRDQLG
ncbi:MAG: helix-turn-helix transcriptional regulator [Acidimicrobiales bacterium]